MFYEKDLDSLFKEMGEQVLINNQYITAIFTQELKTQTTDNDVFQVLYISLYCKTSDVSNVKTNDIVIIHGNNYRIIERLEDGGITTLLLDKV